MIETTAADRLDRDRRNRKGGMCVGALGFLIVSFWAPVTPTMAATMLGIYAFVPEVFRLIGRIWMR